MTMARKLVSSGSPYEKPIGFSRAVRVGNWVAVAGTAPIADDGSVACPGDLYGQTRRCLQIIQAAIESTGASLSDVLRTRVMLRDIARWQEAARAHGEFFAAIRPASTFVEVSSLVQKEWLVEIEADCLIE
jgi:enamine deaminase RidA (YjgF/YER057c/UK114 family)